MGGPPCWKNLIDQFNALVQACSCMAETVRIAGVNGNYPTDAEVAEFVTNANALSKTAQKIQERLAAT